MAEEKAQKEEKRCSDCGKSISKRAEKCRSCAKKKPKLPETPLLLLAWRYACEHEKGIYSFDPYYYGHPARLKIRATCGCDLEYAVRVIYFEGKHYEYCPVCDLSASSHKGERRDEMFYEAICPTKEKT